MAQSRLREQRKQLVAQAALVWADDKLDIDYYVQTGSFGASSQILAFDSDARAMIVQQFEGKANGN